MSGNLTVAGLCFSTVGLVFIANGLSAQTLPSTAHGEWPHYTGDLKGTRYSPLDQIDAENFNDLEIAWTFKTDNLGSRPEYKLLMHHLLTNGGQR